MTMVLGRSGTGKTFCVCGRMDYDADRFSADPDRVLRQIFIAGTHNLVKQARRLRVNSRPVEDRATYQTMGEFIRNMDRRFNPSHVFDQAAYLGWTEFKQDFWGGLGKKHRTKQHHRHSLFPLTVWTEIRSCIKGSFRLCRPRSPLSSSNSRSSHGARSECHASECLTREEYMKLGKQECRLSEEQRLQVYNIFEMYEQHKTAQNKWDYADRVLLLLRQLQADPSGTHLFDKVYVDECQDHTQIEYAILLLLCGGQPNSLFIAGDTAQAVAEVRLLAYMCTNLFRNLCFTPLYCVIGCQFSLY